jgi:hypothetical protein
MADTNEVKEHWFGLKAPEGYTGVVWGARAIFRTMRKGNLLNMRLWYTFDIPYDRQQFNVARNQPLNEEARALENWINKRGVKLLASAVEKAHVKPREMGEISLEDTGYTIRADPRASGGYLYIVAYKTPETEG